VLSGIGGMNDFFLGGEGRLRPANAAVALILVGGDEHYLMQLRDQKAGIFFPGHWGVFGGAIDEGESPERTLRRELQEELGLTVTDMRYFTAFTFDFTFCGHGPFTRSYFEVPVERSVLENLVLGEGSEMRVFSARELLCGPPVVPFDAFAIWLHAAGRRVLAPAPSA
jgi:8-oxo-dGTP pyrophosphatase MutT (NUDIX family)